MVTVTFAVTMCVGPYTTLVITCKNSNIIYIWRGHSVRGSVH